MGTCHENQSATLRYALQRLTGQSHATDREWVEWYDARGKEEFPEPDFEQWHRDLKAIHGE